MAQDEERARRLAASLGALSDAEADHALDLRQRLIEGVNGHHPPNTLASHLFMRDLRDRIFSNIWVLMLCQKFETVATACLMPTKMIVPASELGRVKPWLYMRRLRNDFDRSGVTDASGIIFAGLDCEFDSTRRTCHFHYHLIIGGDKVAALERLRSMPKYARGRVDALEEGLSDIVRLQVKRGPFVNEPDCYTYALKSYAKNHPLILGADGTWQRSRKAYAIPDPDHARWLLWMDRLSIGDLCLLSGMRGTNWGFQRMAF